MSQTDTSHEVSSRRWAMRAKMLAFPLAAAAFVGFLAVGLFVPQSRDGRVGKEGPDFDLALLGGGRVTDEDLRGHPVVLNFWASWCRPCTEEAPALQRAWVKYRGRGLVMLGINVLDREDDAEDFIEEFGITFQNARDPDYRLGIAVGLRGVPETMFLDDQWRFAGVESGPVIGSRGSTRILGPIRPVVLESRIFSLLGDAESNE